MEGKSLLLKMKLTLKANEIETLHLFCLFLPVIESPLSD